MIRDAVHLADSIDHSIHGNQPEEIAHSGREAPGKKIRLCRQTGKTGWPRGPRGQGSRSEKDQAQAGCPHHRFGAALYAQLAQDRVDVELGGVFAYAEAVSNGFVGQAFGQKTQNL